MLKRIQASQAVIGMFFVRPDGSWIDHGMWFGKFLIRDARQLESVTGCGASHVWIDTDKGKDLEDRAVATDAGSAPQPSPAAVTDNGATAPAAVPLVQRRLSVGDELPRAAQILDEVKVVVKDTLKRAQSGQPPDAEACRTVVAPMVESVIRNASALTTLIRLRDKDDYSYMHSVSVSALMIILGRELGFDHAECLDVGLAGLLHDVGKALVPADLLNKPGKLTDEEFEEVRTHPLRGHQLLVDGGLSVQAALDVCLHHHERVDGAGYPNRLSGDALSRWARMGAICDVYDAVTSDRSYKRAWDPAQSLAQMATWQGQFDRALLAAFIKGVGVYPVGALVRLSSAKLAVVTESRNDRPKHPVVKVFYCLKSFEPIKARLVDLSASGVSESIVGLESKADWRSLDMHRLLMTGAGLA